MKTKLVCLLLCFIIVIAACASGCGKKDGTTASSETVSSEIIVDPS